MHNGAQLAIHNHFIVKALDATRAGGLVAVVTSGWTIDAQGTKARTEISKRGQLVAAGASADRFVLAGRGRRR